MIEKKNLWMICMALVALLFTTSLVQAQQATYDGKRLDQAEAQEDLRLLRMGLQDVHPGYSRYASREAMDNLLDDLDNRSRGGITDLDLYLRVSYVLAKIRCGHTKAELPAAFKKYREKTPTYLPFCFRIFAGKMYVDRIDATQQLLERGDEILLINGHPVGDVLATVKEHLSIDGWTDHAKRIELESSSELLGDAVDHFWPMLYDWPDKWRVEARIVNGGAKKQVELEPVTYPNWLKLATEGRRYSDFGSETVKFKTLDDKTAYLAVETFVNYRQPVNPAKIFSPHFEEMRSRGIEHLILDLRRCGGGSDEVPARLAEFLATRPIEVTRRPSWVRGFRYDENLRKHMRTWDQGVWNLPEKLFTELQNGFFEFRPPGFVSSFNIQPRPNHFQGRVTILCGSQNSSGATNFIGLIRGKRQDTRVIGEPTAGTAEGTTAGLIFFLKLPNSGITVRIPALRNFNDIEDFEPGLGVRPDVVVIESVDDFLKQRDSALQEALRE